MNDYRTERCCRASCARIAAGLGFGDYLVTGGGYRDAEGGLRPEPSMIAEMLEVITPQGIEGCQNRVSRQKHPLSALVIWRFPSFR